jgi:hypothetical protein
LSSKNGKHDQPRSLAWLADELGIDRMMLRRRIIAKFGNSDRKFTVREAFDAYSARSESEEARRRKNLADAEASEIDSLNKRKLFMFRTHYENGVKDLAVQTRTTIEAASYISKEDRRRLVKQIAEIKASVAEPSHK